MSRKFRRLQEKQGTLLHTGSHIPKLDCRSWTTESLETRDTGGIKGTKSTVSERRRAQGGRKKGEQREPQRSCGPHHCPHTLITPSYFSGGLFIAL